MNGWLTAASGLLLAGVGPALCGTFTGPARRRVLAQNLATVLTALTFLLLAQGYARSAYTDLALALSVLGPAGTLVYQRLLAGELAAHPPGPRSSRGLTAVSAVLVPLVVLPACLATPPGRATGKLLVTGLLLVAGNVVCTRAVTALPVTASADGSGGEGRPVD